MSNISSQHPITSLSPRERDILCLMVQGRTNQQMADELFITKESVRAVIRSINNKLGIPKYESSADTRQATIDLALRHNICNSTSQQSTPIKNNLPHQTTTFIGRAEELANLADLLITPSNRLITILASGGMGKTRLALALARRQLADFRDGVFFVPLTAITSKENLINQIGSQIGMNFHSDNRSTMQQVLDTLRDKQRLLVLDNFEQLIPHTRIIKDILTESPQVKIILTSRERLGLNGEIVFRIGGLNTNTPDASALFIDSLKRAKPDFEPDESDHLQSNRICHLVGGMPLALVLASNWIEILSLSEIADEISRSLDLLSEESHENNGVRAVFDRTWERLTDIQKRVFKRLSIFIDGFTRESANAVADANLLTLKQLVDKSLIQLTDMGRYTLHELLRQYAFEKLMESGDHHPTADGHAAYFADFVASREQHVKGSGQMQALAELVADFSNIETSWYWAIDHHQSGKVIRMLECLFYIAEYRSKAHIFLDMLRYADANLKDAPEEEDQRLWGQIVAYRIHIERFAGQLRNSDEEANLHLKSSLKIARRYDHPRDIAFCLLMLATQAINHHAYHESIALYEQSCVIYAELDDNTRLTHCYSQMAYCYHMLGQHDKVLELDVLARNVAEDGGNIIDIANHLYNHAIGLESYALDVDRAIAEHQNAMALVHQAHYTDFEYHIYISIGSIELRRGNISKAREIYEESLEAAQSSGDLSLLGRIYYGLGLLNTINEEFESARDIWQKAYQLSTDTGHDYQAVIAQWGLGLTLSVLGKFEQGRIAVIPMIQQTTGTRLPKHVINNALPIAIILANTGEPIRTIEQLGFALSHPKSISGWMHKWDFLARLMEDLEAELGADIFQEAWDRGANRELDDIVEEHIRWVEENSTGD